MTIARSQTDASSRKSEVTRSAAAPASTTSRISAWISARGAGARERAYDLFDRVAHHWSRATPDT
jgi:hypothetical protein